MRAVILVSLLLIAAVARAAAPIHGWTCHERHVESGRSQHDADLSETLNKYRIEGDRLVDTGKPSRSWKIMTNDRSVLDAVDPPVVLGSDTQTVVKAVGGVSINKVTRAISRVEVADGEPDIRWYGECETY